MQGALVDEKPQVGVEVWEQSEISLELKNYLVSMQYAFDLRARSPYFLTTKSSDNRFISARGRQIFNVRPGTSLFP